MVAGFILDEAGKNLLRHHLPPNQLHLPKWQIRQSAIPAANNTPVINEDLQQTSLQLVRLAWRYWRRLLDIGSNY